MKNFAVGGVSGGADRAASWGRWAFGYYGDAYNRSVDDRGQFSHFRIGGGLAIALMVGVLTGGAGFLATYAAMLVGSVVLGAATGIVSGGFQGVSAGRERRQAAELKIAQERDAGKIDQITRQQEKLQNAVSKTHDKIGKLQERKEAVHNRMQAREEKATPKAGGFAERELQRRAAATQQQAKRV